MAVDHQYRNNHRHVPDGLPDPEYPNRDGAAIQAKLDELILVTSAENSFIGIEHLTEEEVNEFREKCKAAAARAERQGRSAVKRTRAKARKAAEDAVE
jgi:low affinity Fe/Cu permease